MRPEHSKRSEHGAAEEVITYCLREGADSRSYYETVIPFLDEVLGAVRAGTGDLLAAFSAYASAEDPATTPEERYVELLLLGVLGSIYGGRAMATSRPARRLLSALSRMRTGHPGLKPMLDPLRGLLMGALLFPGHPPRTLALRHLGELVEWLDATGEFPHEAARLKRWDAFLASLPAERATRYWEAVQELAAWFESRSLAVLGRFTERVEGFLRERYPSYAWREDRAACGRSRVEYHLGMVGSELMNRAFRSAFEARRCKALLLPICMRALPDESCRAARGSGHLRCAGCTPTCRAHQVTRLGHRYGYDVRLIPHASEVYAQGSAEASASAETGIIGVACIGQLLSGGWTATARGLAAQCVPLDYCGCKAHWHAEGIPTDLNIKRLQHLIAIGPSAPPAR